MSYLFQIFGRHSWDDSALVQNNSRFLVCLSVCSLPHFLTDIMLTVDISSFAWYIFQIFFGEIPWMLVHLLQMILNFMYVCQSVCLLTSLPKLIKGIYPVLDEISFWTLLTIFLRQLSVVVSEPIVWFGDSLRCWWFYGSLSLPKSFGQH